MTSWEKQNKIEKIRSKSPESGGSWEIFFSFREESDCDKLSSLIKVIESHDCEYCILSHREPLTKTDFTRSSGLYRFYTNTPGRNIKNDKTIIKNKTIFTILFLQ